MVFSKISTKKPTESNLISDLDIHSKLFFTYKKKHKIFKTISFEQIRIEIHLWEENVSTYILNPGFRDIIAIFRIFADIYL